MKLHNIIQQLKKQLFTEGIQNLILPNIANFAREIILTFLKTFSM